jgi:hypothetical protein
MILSTDAEKTFNKIQNDKSTEETRNGRNIPQ